VHAISRTALKEAAGRYPDLESPLDTWYRTTKKARWKSLHDVRQTYPHADQVGTCTVFNIKGNQYRLVVMINYQTGRIYIRHVLTHAEYDREGWKDECG
jgi:mRNA interferase HigB